VISTKQLNLYFKKYFYWRLAESLASDHGALRFRRTFIENQCTIPFYIEIMKGETLLYIVLLHVCYVSNSIWTGKRTDKQRDNSI